MVAPLPGTGVLGGGRVLRSQHSHSVCEMLSVRGDI